jgi:autotransporter-associated beta strand protein
VNGGTLLVNSPGSLAATSAVTVAAGGALGGNGTINGTVNVAADGLLAPGGAAAIGTLTLANGSASSLTLNGKNALLFDLPNAVTTGDLIDITGASGGLVLNGANYISLKTPNGPVPEGSYTLMNYSAATGSGTLTFQNGTSSFGNATLTVGPTSVTLAVGPGGLSGLNTWSGSVSGVWDGGALNWTKDGTVSSAFTDGDAVTFDDSGSTTATISSVAPVAPDSVLFNNTTKNYTVSAVIAGGTTLAKTGSGTTTLTGSNTFTGGITISGGTLGTSGTGRLGTTTTNIYAGAMSIAPGATYNVAGGSQRLSGPVTGGGTLRNSSGNDLILDNNGNSYGALTINGGRTFLNSNAGVLPAAATVTVTGGNLVFGFGTTRNNAISVSSGGILTARNPTTLTNVTLPGSGTVIFNNDDSNTRLITINNGQTLTGALTVQIGGSRMLAGNTVLGGVTMAGNLTGGGGLVVASSGNFANNPTLFGTGVLTLAGTNDYTGPTSVTAGTLAVTGSLGATAVTVSSPAILGGNGNIGGNVTIDSGATHALAVAATPAAQVTRAITGTLTLTAGNLLDLTAAATPAAGEYVLATADTISGTTAEADIDYNGISGTVTVDTVSNPDRLLLTVTSGGFSAWITGTFANGTVTNQGPNDDDDNDGISNLVEYAIAGEDPTVPNASIGSFNGTLLSFSKRLDATGLTYAIQESTDLGIADDWDGVGSYTENTASTISYTLTPGTPVRNFLRLQVLSN